MTSQFSPVPGSPYDPAVLHKELMAMQAAAAAASNNSTATTLTKKSYQTSTSHQTQANKNILGSPSPSSHHGVGGGGSSGSGGSIGVPSSVSNTNSATSALISPRGSLGGHISGVGSLSSGNSNCPPSLRDRTKDNVSLNALNSLSHFGSLGMTPQQSVQAAMNAFAANTSVANVNNNVSNCTSSGSMAGGNKSSKDYMPSVSLK